MYSFFCKSLRTFCRTHADGMEINITVPTTFPNRNGHIRFYSRRNLEPIFFGMLMDHLEIIDHCLQDGDIVVIWLRMDEWTDVVIPEILDAGSRYGSSNITKNIDISLTTDECDDSVTSLRTSLLKNAFQNLAVCNGYTIGSNGYKILFSKKNNSHCPNLILCGSVITNITTEAYKQKKHDDISKMSANRTDESSEYPVDIISKLCHISIVYELLSIRHNKNIHLHNETSNKDKGIFIMYNYSRLCQILAVFEKNVLDNYYCALPNINGMEFKYLHRTEEWILVFNYLSVYPSLIEECVQYLSSAQVGVHKLCTFLMEMSSCVSSFYHKYNILMDPIPEFLPLMHARLYLVKALIQVYENVFHILGIEAVREI